jgi:hypothetical protein
LHQPGALRDLARCARPPKKQRRVDYGPTPDRHDQHVYAWETTSTSLYGYAGKVGKL